MAQKSKQAIILIHGIGEQRPMDALRRFVDVVWTRHTDAHHPYAKTGMFSKPDTVSNSFELRRLSTTKNSQDVLTDFYELYWAHLMEGTSLGHVYGWARRLLWRNPWSLPANLVPAWFALFSIIVVALFFGVHTVLPEDLKIIEWPIWVTGLLGLLTTALLIPLLNTVVGDAARYLDPAPTNVGRRQAIRSAGVAVLKRLHDSSDYSRIVVVGHSLGSVIGYDILTYAWDLYNDKGDKRDTYPALDALEAYLNTPGFDVTEYRELQRALQQELRSRNNPWLITDFVTLGSPLAHAQVLLAKDMPDLKRKQADRELPTCPPFLENGKISYTDTDNNNNRILHHAALFGPTQWTNLYFPARHLIFGDLIGGPVSPQFGEGILDHAVTTDRNFGLFSHNLYWSQRADDETHIALLRQAIDLSRPL